MKFFLSDSPFGVTAKDIGVPTSTKDIPAGIANMLEIAMTVVGMLAIVFIIVGGIQMILSAGDAKRYAQARQTLTYAVVGLLVALGARAIVTYVADAVK